MLLVLTDMCNDHLGQHQIALLEETPDILVKQRNGWGVSSRVAHQITTRIEQPALNNCTMQDEERVQVSVTVTGAGAPTAWAPCPFIPVMRIQCRSCHHTI